MYYIDIKKSKINIITQLLQYESQHNTIKPHFKKTAKLFQKRYGFDVVGAPIIYKAGTVIYKLSFMQGNYSAKLGGHRYEVVQYFPIVDVGGKFERLKLKP